MRLFSPSLLVRNLRAYGSFSRYVTVFTFTSFLALSIACGSGSSSSTAVNSGSTTQSGSSSSELSLSNSLPGAAVGTDYKATISVSGGSTPYAFSVASGELPPGLGLSSTSGTISGTPSATGKANFAVSVTDGTGQSTQSSYQLSVASTASPNPPSSPTSNSADQGTALSALQHSGGWASYGQNGSHNYVDCSPSPCDGITFWMGQNIGNPSMSGEASGYSVGGSTPFSDGLFNNHLIGPGSSQGMPDNDRSLVPSLHDFTYDVYFYGGDFGASQALEFDINQFFNNEGYIFGHECRIAAGNEWDVWDNVNQKWVPTGIGCHPKENSWNHLTIKVQRNSNNELVYQSITLNGQTSTLNWTFPHGSAPGWYGVTVNYQMDGNPNQDSYTVYLDNLTFSYQ